MSQAPHQGVQLQESLDLLMTCAAFDQAVSILLINDGVFQIHTHQNPIEYKLKDTASIYKALEIYDVKELWVERESINERGITEQNLSLNFQIISKAEVSKLMQQFEVIYSY